MAFGSPREEQAALSEINVTPLVDVMLVLLVVFIVTAPLLTQSVGVNLPKTVAAAPPPPRPVTLVSLDSTGQLYLDREKLDSAALADRLRQRKADQPDLTVQFEIDEQVRYGQAAAILAIAQQAGITQLTLQTRH